MTGRTSTRRALAALPTLAVVFALLPGLALAQNRNTGQAQAARSANDELIQAEKFVAPPPELAEAVTAPRHVNLSLSNLNADKTWFLDEISDGPVKTDVFSKPFDELGGEFIDFAANRSRVLTIRSNIGIRLISAADGTTRQIQIPPGARVSNASWSPDGKSVAFFAHTPDATHIWIADAATGRSRQLTRAPVLATSVTSFDWVAGGKSIATIMIPDARAPRPVKPAAPTGPHIKVAEETDKNLLRTYASLMATPYDQALLEWHATGQLALIDVQNRSVKKIGAPTTITSISFSPDGAHVRVTRMVKPFSYVVPVGNFGNVEEMWDANGTVLTELNKRELNLGVRTDNPVTAPGAGGPAAENQQGKREMSWRTDGQGLTYLEQEPAPPGDSTAADAPPAGRGGRGDAAGAAGQNGPRRMDRVFQWLPPFDSTSRKVVYEQTTRMAGHRFSEDMKVLFFTERQGQNTTEVAVVLDAPTEKHTLARYRGDDIYANPGTLVTTRGGGGGAFAFAGGSGRGGGGGGGSVQLSADGQHVFFQGTQYDKNPEEIAPKTFIDRVNIRNGAKNRVWESANNGVFERVATILDIEAGKFIISRESPKDPPQSFLRENGQTRQLTQNRDLFPDLTAAPKQSFIVTRPDGFKFKVNVTLPPGYREGTRLPAMFWFYPREYAGQEEYDRGARTYNKNAFQNFGTRSLQFLTRLGYAVVEPDAPIVGETGAMNNNYENDLRNNLSVVIDSLDKRGLVDRGRIGIGGHSYGAFSTVNAMVHTPFFKAGIAGDGNYNRTLTPLNFQSERRVLWDAPEVYLRMSPLLYANNLTGALLMYHGLHDQNVGTNPINSPNLFHALNGLGKTVSMYLYEFEDHGPATLETQLDMWARWAAWLDKYVKNPGAAAQKVTTDGPVSMR